MSLLAAAALVAWGLCNQSVFVDRAPPSAISRMQSAPSIGGGSSSPVARNIVRDTRGMCPSFDEWAPVLRNFLYFYRPGSVTSAAVEAAFDRHAIGHWVQVVNGAVFVTVHPNGFRYAERGASIVAQVQRMVSRGWANVPDGDLLFDVMDAPRFLRESAEELTVPVGSLSADAEHVDYPIPDMGFFQWRELSNEEWTKRASYNESIHACLAAGAATPYASRTRSTIFRGSCNSRPREVAVEESRARPDILDIKCTGGMPLLNLSHYAVVANFEGNGYSARTKWLLALGSPLLYLLGGPNRVSKVQFFYPLLTPFVHYYPVASPKQLVPATEWLLGHPAEAEAMGRAAAAFVRAKLMPVDIDCVWLYYLHVMAELRARGEPGRVRPHAHLPAVDVTTMGYGALLSLLLNPERTWVLPG